MFAGKGTIFEFVFKVNHENLEQVLYFFPKVFIRVLSLISFLQNGKVNSMSNYLVNIYLFKVTNRNTRKRWEICSKLTITPQRRQWHRSGVFIVNFEYIFTTFSSVSIGDFEQASISWVLAFVNFFRNRSRNQSWSAVTEMSIEKQRDKSNFINKSTSRFLR